MFDMRFDDRVVVITGSGGGIGRTYALDFAARGAKVVVNDLGGSAHGEGSSSSAADAVVKEIEDAGGTAVANYDSVTDGERIIETAMDNFGRVDVVINNAGILRDVTFQKMTEEEWDLVYNVHVKGAFKVTHAAWPHMRNQEYGRLIFTASAAGVYGNFGQANYSMAKLGLHGMSQTLALEGVSRNIKSNTIAPIAGSRLLEGLMDQKWLDALKPEYVMPLVVKLCHESNVDTGGLYEVGAGWMSKNRWQRGAGHSFDIANEMFRAEDVRDNWSKITDFSDPIYPASIKEANTPIFKNLMESEVV